MFFVYLFGIDQVSSDVRKSSPTVFWHPEAGDIQIRFKECDIRRERRCGGLRFRGHRSSVCWRMVSEDQHTG